VLRDVQVPALVVRGRHDRICPADWARSLAPAETLGAGAHMVPLTHGDQLAPLVQRLVASGG
jgi:pimeloyl-ACP methyl ester carboxylesterase